MPVQVPAEAYMAFARGEISEGELQGLEKMAQSMNKTALNLTAPSAASLGGFVLAAPTLAYAGAEVPQAIDATLGAMTFNRDLKRVLDVNPHLGSPDDPNLRMAFKTLRSMNPEYSKDPLIAGTILDMVMTNRMDPDDPTSPPRFDPALLQSIQNKKPTSVAAAMQQGSAAPTSALRGMLED